MKTTKAINGNKIRAYQGGEIIGMEFNTYFSEMLQFVAVEACYSDTSSSKMVEVKLDDEVLYSDTFDYCKIIHSARLNDRATSLFVFHNGNNDSVGGRFNDVMSFIKMEQSKLILNKLARIEGVTRESNKLISDSNNLEKTVRRLTLNEMKIPMWVRRIFKAV